MLAFVPSGVSGVAVCRDTDRYTVVIDDSRSFGDRRRARRFGIGLQVRFGLESDEEFIHKPFGFLLEEHI